MFNVDTLQLIAALGEMAEGLKNGGLKECGEFAGGRYSIHEGVLYDAGADNKIVLDYSGFDGYKSYYEDVSDGCRIRAVTDLEEDDEPYIQVSFTSEADPYDRMIVVQPGRWYFA